MLVSLNRFSGFLKYLKPLKRFQRPSASFTPLNRGVNERIFALVLALSIALFEVARRFSVEPVRIKRKRFRQHRWRNLALKKSSNY
jgi:hypothetical protein